MPVTSVLGDGQLDPRHSLASQTSQKVPDSRRHLLLKKYSGNQSKNTQFKPVTSIYAHTRTHTHYMGQLLKLCVIQEHPEQELRTIIQLDAG